METVMNFMHGFLTTHLASAFFCLVPILLDILVDHTSQAEAWRTWHGYCCVGKVGITPVVLCL